MILYNIILKLNLAIQLNIIIIMKEIKDLKLSFIKYISDILIKIKNMIVKQLFFILERDSNSCILEWSFETVTHMIRQTLNDDLIHVTVFNLKNDLIQATFQSYISEDISNHYEYQMIETNTI